MIFVCNLAEMPQHVAAIRPGRLISITGPEYLPATPAGFDRANHLRLGLHDIVEPQDGQIPPQRHHVAQLIRFLDGRLRSEPVIIHCFAGVSRSMAGALIAMVLDAGGQENEAAARLREVAPHAQPNRRIIDLADDLLDRNGRLVAACEAMGPGVPVDAGPLVRMEALAADLPQAPGLNSTDTRLQSVVGG